MVNVFFGIIDSSIVHRMGFYSLRNVFDHECSMLTAFTDHAIYWPPVQARKDMRVQNFMEINRKTRGSLSAVRSTEFAGDGSDSTMVVKDSSEDNRKEDFSQGLFFFDRRSS